MAENALTQAAKALHQRAIVWDNIYPFFDLYFFTGTMTGAQAGQFDPKYHALERYRKAGASYVGLTIGGARPNLGVQMRTIAHVKGFLRNNADRFVLAKNAEDVVAAKRDGKMAVGFNFQGGNALEDMLDMVSVYYDLGIRQMLLCYNSRNGLGNGCHEPNDDGLSQFGKAVVREMNALGMIVDASHTGYQTTMDIFKLSKAPVVFSHSNPATLQPHPRNITDDQIKACVDSGGVIGAVGFDGFLPGREAQLEALLQVIDYLVETAGIDHVGLGLDWIYCEDMFRQVLAVNKAAYPDGGRGDYDTRAEFLGPEILPKITAGLLARGYAEADILKILGENWMRVQREVIKS